MGTQILEDAEMKMVKVSDIVESEINPRKDVDKKTLKELIESIEAQGLLQPIILRWNDKKEMELVCGRRRLEAHKVLKRDKIAAFAMELTDNQAREIALVENLQRSDLHPIEEAEGIMALLDQDLKLEEISAKLGSNVAYLSRRLRLLELRPEIKKDYLAGKLTHTLAFGIARLPKEQQTTAYEELYGETDEEKIKSMLDDLSNDLSGVAFDTKDPNLVPKAGACVTCTKRTGNNPGLFDQVKDSLCLDYGCFKLKVAAHCAIAEKEAEEKGFQVIRGNDAFAVANDYSQKYVKLTEKCPDDPKGRTYSQLAGKAGKELTKCVALHNEKSVTVYRKTEVMDAIKNEGHKFAAQKLNDQKKARAEKQDSEAKNFFGKMARGFELNRVLSKKKVPGDLVEILRIAVYGLMNNSEGYRLAPAFPEWEAVKEGEWDDVDDDKLRRGVDKASGPQLLTAICLLTEETYDWDEKDTEKVLKIDKTKIGNEVKKLLKAYKDREAKKASIEKIVE